METQLEKVCQQIDDILTRHGLSAKVAGGYIAGNGLLFSLTDTTFINTGVCHDIQQALKASQVIATVGVVLVQRWSTPVSNPPYLLEQATEVEAGIKPPVETINIMSLIAAHQRGDQ